MVYMAIFLYGRLRDDFILLVGEHMQIKISTIFQTGHMTVLIISSKENVKRTTEENISFSDSISCHF